MGQIPSYPLQELALRRPWLRSFDDRQTEYVLHYFCVTTHPLRGYNASDVTSYVCCRDAQTYSRNGYAVFTNPDFSMVETLPVQRIEMTTYTLT